MISIFPSIPIKAKPFELLTNIKGFQDEKLPEIAANKQFIQLYESNNQI